VKPNTGFNAPCCHFAVAIGCEILNASDLVYADGSDLNEASLVVSDLRA
jgi:predicted transcriptional regulator